MVQGQYIWDRSKNQICFNSWRLIHRFTGEWATAKVYEQVSVTADRDREMVMFCMQDGHSSIVRYYMATELQGVPVAITDTHASMLPFVAVEQGLPSMHPGM